jgi:hypothetical protein
VSASCTKWVGISMTSLSCRVLRQLVIAQLLWLSAWTASDSLLRG